MRWLWPVAALATAAPVAALLALLRAHGPWVRRAMMAAAALALVTAIVPFVFDDEVLIRQFGEGRRNQGEATLRLWQVEGPDAVDPPPGAERVAYAEHDDGPVALLAEPIA
jgi:hypothetical protein